MSNRNEAVVSLHDYVVPACDDDCPECDNPTTCDGCGATAARYWNEAMQGLFCNDCIKATDPAPVVVPVTYGDRHSCGYTYASRGHATLCG